MALVFYPPKEINNTIARQVPRDPKKRITSYPYISGDTYRAFCNHSFDEMGLPISVDNIKRGDTIFVSPPFLDYFFTEIHPHIKEPYIIVSHNADDPVPGSCASYLDDEKLYAWFSINIDRSHPKLHAIPIGIVNQCWKPGNIHVFDAQRKRLPAKDKWLYCNFSCLTYRPRGQIRCLFWKKPFAYFAERKDFKHYLFDIARSKFVLSPRGAGLDCYRTWEALLLGSIPIVSNTTINELFKGLPVIIVDDWSTVTEEFLEQKWQEMSNKEYQWHRLFADYWLTKIALCQQRARMHYLCSFHTE